MKIKITHTSYPGSVPVGSVMTVTSKEPNGAVHAKLDGDDFPWYIYAGSFYVIDDNTKTWGEMTPEEKGALLLAAHEGKVIEVRNGSGDWVQEYPMWFDKRAYRVKPEPVRETVALCYRKDVEFVKNKIGTIVLEDGVPVSDSIRMDPVSW